MSITSALRKPKPPKDKREFLLVCHKPCDECLFSKNKLVDDSRRNEILLSCDLNDKPFTCHKHSMRAMDLRGVEKSKAMRISCHGYWTRFRAHRLVFRLADMVGLVRFVDFDGQEISPEVAHGEVVDAVD